METEQPPNPGCPESVYTIKPHINCFSKQTVNCKDEFAQNYYFSVEIIVILLHSILELKEAVLNSDQQVMEVSEVEMVYDIKSWLIPHLDTPHGHTNPHNFLFRLGENEKAEMQYRNWSTDSWLPLPPKYGVVLLKVSAYL